MSCEPLGLYIHVPFCVRKCAYCDFNAYSGMGALVEPFVGALLTEIAASPDRGAAVDTVFFGGGTPTYLPAHALGRVMGRVRETFDLSPTAEVTSEANPTSSDAARFTAMREAGFNRLSIGVQSFDDRLLRAVDREHTGEEALHAVEAARNAGFDNLSIDLMFGLPGQTAEDWDAALNQALALETEHLSVYALTLEPGTRFERLHAGGKLILPDEETELWMFERAIERLTEAGFEHYEVSNFARPARRSRHNLRYWHNEEYLGFGPGAVSYRHGRRWTKEKLPARYIAKVKEGRDLTVEEETLGTKGAIAETLMAGLRLREGIALGPLEERFGVDPEELFGTVFRSLEERGLLERQAGRIRLSYQGLLFANNVFLELLPD